MPEIPESRVKQIVSKLDLMQAHINLANALNEEIRALIQIKSPARPKPKSPRKKADNDIVAMAIAKRHKRLEKKWGVKID